jgi:hypothetical protein
MGLPVVNGCHLDSVDIDNIARSGHENPFIPRSNCRNCLDTLDLQHFCLPSGAEISPL